VAEDEQYMDLNEFKILADSAQAIATALGIVVGGGWALKRYVFQKEGLPRLEFRVDVNFVGIQEGQWLVELLGLLENKGAVPHQIRDLGFELRCLDAGETPIEGDICIQRQVRFGRVLKEASWTPGDSTHAMVILPNVSIRYSHVARLPPEAKFALLHGRLDYLSEEIESLRADKLVLVPKSEEALQKTKCS
jgi:hypothetical protein